MMNKIAIGLFISLFLVLPLLNLNLTFAKDGSDSAKPNVGKFIEKRKEIKQDFVEKKTEISQKKAEVSFELRQKRAIHIKEMLLLVLERFSKADERLDKIAQRIQTRINKFEGRGIDVSTAQAALDSCEVQDAALASAISAATSNVGALDPSGENIKNQVESAHNLLKSVKQVLFDYHKCLRSTLPIIGSIAPNKEATEDAQ